MLQTKFTTPTLYDAGGDITKPWYVEYYFLNPATMELERFRPTFKINYHRTLSARYVWGKEAVKFMKERLMDGFDPFEEKKLMGLATGIIPPQAPAPKTCLNELQKVVDDLCKVSTKNAGETYRLMFNRFKKYLQAKELLNIALDKINLTRCIEFQQYVCNELNLARKTVNSTVSHLAILWDELKLSSNPFRSVPPLKNRRGRIKETRKDIFEPFTTKELQAIIKHLLAKDHRPFIRFLGIIYYAWARPIEIMRLRVKDIDMDNRAIIFRKEETKNDKPARVQMLEPLYQLLKEMELDRVPANYYLFSREFLPGDKMMNQRYHFNDRWNELVKDQLEIDKNPYALKHSGNIEYLMKNKGRVDLKWQQRQNRHSSAVQTEKYNRGLGVYFIDTELISFGSLI